MLPKTRRDAVELILPPEITRWAFARSIWLNAPWAVKRKMAAPTWPLGLILMRVRLEHRPIRTLSPLTRWVHRGFDGPDYAATVFNPPLPNLVDGKGYPVWFVEHRGRMIYLVSPEEIAHAIDILGRKILPRARDLGRAYLAVNSHWLSRLHSTWKPWKARQELVRLLKLAAASSAL